MRVSPEFRRLSGTLACVVMGSMTLVSCGGGSSGGGTGNVTASGLLPQATGCQYLLDQNLGITAAQLNADGCAYTGPDGKVAYWAGTNGTFGPGANTAGNDLNPPSATGGSTTNGSTAGASTAGASTTGTSTTGTSTTGTSTTGTSTTGTSTAGTSTTGGDSESTTGVGSTTTGSTTTGSTTTSGTTTADSGSTSTGGSTTAGGVQFPATSTIPARLADGDGSSAMYRNAPNSSILTGPVFGSDNLSGNALRKSVPFIVENSDSNVSIEHILLVERPGLALSELLFYISNSGTSTHCFVKIEGINIYDKSGSIMPDLISLDFGFVEGTVNYFANTDISTNTCIAAGDTVYLSKRIKTDIASVQGIVIDKLGRSTSTSNTDIATLVEAVSYSIDGDDLNVTLANRSVVTASVAFINLVGLDAEGFPVGSTLSFGPELAPGEEATVNFNAGFSSARASTARIIIDYEVVTE